VGRLTSMAGEEKTGRWLLFGKMAVWGMISSRGLSRAWCIYEGGREGGKEGR